MICAVGLPPPARGAEVPAWLFPLDPPSSGGDRPPDTTQHLHLANSRRSFTEAQLNDLFFTPDWHPQSHAPMPAIVLRGRAPGTCACGYCHLPSGQGRPENAPLAGLPAAYIVQQIEDIKSGARRSAWHGPAFVPIDLMRDASINVTQADSAAAAAYFSAQTLHSHVTVVERERIPRMREKAWIYAPVPNGGEEALGQRLIEWAPDFARHERHDADARYTAFVPPGSLARGREIFMSGLPGVTQPCSGCHGERLQGMGLIPPLAGRSPTYLLRQLVAFQTKDRSGLMATPMQVVVAKLELADMISLAAFAAAN
jgi:cytochrome c553